MHYQSIMTDPVTHSWRNVLVRAILAFTPDLLTGGRSTNTSFVPPKCTEWASLRALNVFSSSSYCAITATSTSLQCPRTDTPSLLYNPSRFGPFSVRMMVHFILTNPRLVGRVRLTTNSFFRYYLERHRRLILTTERG